VGNANIFKGFDTRTDIKDN